MARLLPGGGLLPQPVSRRCSGRGGVGGRTVGQPERDHRRPAAFQRQALLAAAAAAGAEARQRAERAALDAIGYELEVVARGERGARFRGRVVAEGHPGYRSTPEMVVCAALGLADGTLGRTPHFGIVSPAAGLGIDAVPALRAAGVRFTAGP